MLDIIDQERVRISSMLHRGTRNQTVRRKMKTYDMLRIQWKETRGEVDMVTTRRYFHVTTCPDDCNMAQQMHPQSSSAMISKQLGTILASR